MHLEGSCRCGAVRFSVEAHSPVPFDVSRGKGHVHVRRWPEESLEDWHRRHRLRSP